MSRRSELLNILKIAQDSVDLEIKETSNLIKQSYATFKKPLLVSVTTNEAGAVVLKVYAYAISYDGSRYLLYKDEYKNGSSKRIKFSAATEETLGFLSQSLYESNAKVVSNFASAGGSTSKVSG